ncbi:F-box/kelch-repeat protein At3g06240-like [Bidens hawaiensis]|uniref:F-box/kelch-repeat protein At3g06240-like n=1 Tax=Bidens hawaiensis TaxID=980011 RepID=UPI00404B6FA5
MPRIHPQLPTHIIQSEVLPRLPAKSICRFRRVCKSWNSFLSMPTFARMHLRYQTNYKLLLDPPTHSFRTFDWDNSITTRPIPFVGDVSVLASLDGLVCVALENTRELAFWNPQTGAYKKFKTSFYDLIRNGTSFAFYVESSNDYKLIHLVSEGAFIYSLRLNSWRKINTSSEISKHRPNIKWSTAVVLEGKVYFGLGMAISPHVCIVSFDVECEKFKEIQAPFINCDAHLGSNLVALNGCIHLCVSYVYFLNEILRCDMWRMDGDGWMKAAVFSRPNCFRTWIHRQIHTKTNVDLLAIWKDNDSIKNVDLADLVIDMDYYLLVRPSKHEHKGVVYFETLVSPNP